MSPVAYIVLHISFIIHLSTTVRVAEGELNNDTNDRVLDVHFFYII